MLNLGMSGIYKITNEVVTVTIIGKQISPVIGHFMAIIMVLVIYNTVVD